MDERTFFTSGFLFTALWQSSLCLAAGLAANAAWKRQSSRAHFVLLLSLIAAICLPFASRLAYVSGWGIPHKLAAKLGLDAIGLPAANQRITDAILLLWVAVGALILARFLFSLFSGLLLLARAKPLVREAVHKQLEDASRQLCADTTPVIFTTREVACPAVWCWSLHPSLLVPAEMASAPASVPWRSVFAHELAHLKRRDHVSALLTELAAVALFWQPLYWIARRQIFQRSDEACDQWAICSGEAPEDYAEALLAITPQKRTLSALSMVSGKNTLKRRLEYVLRDDMPPTPAVGRAWGARAAAFALAASALLALAQPTPKPEPPSDNLLVNPGMEKGTQTPQSWAQCAPVDGVEYLWDRTTAHSGKASLCLKKTKDRYFPIAQWLQKIEKPLPAQATHVELGTWVKAQKVTKAILDVQFTDANEQWSHKWASYIGQEKEADPLADHDWKYYTARVAIPPGTKGVSIALQIYGPGTVWFDDVTARYIGAQDPAKAAPGAKSTDAKDSGATVSLEQSSSLDQLLAELHEMLRSGDMNYDLPMKVAKLKDPRAIPVLIGLIDADNSSGSVYSIGHYGLSPLTGVRFSKYHDGPWWRRWWEANKSRYPEAVRNAAIPGYPKTPRGRNYIPFPEDLETTQGMLRQLEKEVHNRQPNNRIDIAEQMGEHPDPAFIPALIGVIDADNSDDTIYQVGYYGLGKITRVKYSAFHDGGWWRRWWEKNKTRYPEAVRNTPIPRFPQTPNALKHIPFAEDIDTSAGLIRYLEAELRRSRRQSFGNIAREMTKRHDPAFIPTLIGVIDADSSDDTIYQMGYYGLSEITGVTFSESHDGPWWKQWWQENKTRYPEAVRNLPIPEYPRAQNTRKPVPRAEYTRASSSPSALHSPPKAPEPDRAEMIPALIAQIDADNSYNTIYGIGYYRLGSLTKVKYSPFHDGPWWRRWWEKNKARYPEAVRNRPIPELPKTANGQKHTAFPEDMDTTTGMLRYMEAEFRKGNLRDLNEAAQQLAEQEDPAVIPALIGMIEADNSYDTVRMGSVISRLAGVSPSHYHDGAWWRRWWEANKSRYPEAIRNLPIPEYPKTAYGKKYVPFAPDMETTQGKLRQMESELREGKLARGGLVYIAQAMAEHGDPVFIPALIGVIDADNTTDTINCIGSSGLERLTGVRHDETHDANWWREWWEKNKSDYPPQVQALSIPDYRQAVAEGRKNAKANEKEAALADVAYAPVQQLTVPSNKQMRYLLIGAAKEDISPSNNASRLLIVLPGGDGSEVFHPFIWRIYKNVLGEGYVVAQPVAFKWTPSQQIVWPTRVNPVLGQKFSTEEHVEAVVADVERRCRIDKRHVYIMAWSSGGPAAYATALQEKTAVTGAYIAMSVFRPEWMPPLKYASKRPFYIEHSPEDEVCPIELARNAETQLGKAGALVKFTTYEGGHGWQGDLYGRIREALFWLDEKSQSF